MSEKKHAPSARKKKKARQQGTIERHDQACSSVSGVVLLMAVWFLLPGWFTALKRSLTALKLGGSTAAFEVSPMIQGRFLMVGRQLVLELLLALAGAAFLSIFLSVAARGSLMWRPPGAPQFSKLNPLATIKNVPASWSRQLLLFTGGVVVAAGGVLVLWSYRSLLLLRLETSAPVVPPGISSTCRVVGIALLSVVGALALVMALLQIVFEKRRVSSRLMMTDIEMKQEVKEDAPNPEIRSARRALFDALMNEELVEKVKASGVVVVSSAVHER